MKAKANKTTESGTKEINNKIEDRTTFFDHAFRNILLVSLPLVVVSGFVLSLSHSSARVSSNDSLSISVPSSCTLSSSVDEAHSASIINGTYESEIGKTTLTTFCNDRNGYSVYAIGYSLNSEGNNKLVSNINSNYDIVSGTATNGNTSNWAMKLTGVTTITDNNSNTTVNANTPPTITPSFTNYTTVPTEWTKVATIASGTTDMLQGSGFTTTYATYISPTQAAGSYTGQVKYLLTHPSSAPAETYYMQNISEWADEMMPNEGDSVIATDIRDGKGYWVTRLADGHIWMTQNLDFDITANTTLNSMTTDLNVAYNSTTGQYAEYNDGYSVQNGIIYWTPTSTATTINFGGTTVTDWQNSNAEPYSASKTDDAGTDHASIGNYYNWTAAIASNNSNNYVTGVVANSICPKGWRLPNSAPKETGYEFSKLLYSYGITKDDNNMTGYALGGYNKIVSSPVYFMQSGFVTGNYVNELANYGNYWSSDSSNLNFNSTSVNPASNYFSGFGFSIRCLAR